jgi:hypothetical protein
MNPIHLWHFANGSQTSSNWSGYAVCPPSNGFCTTGDTFTGVQAAWNQPAGTCTSKTTAAAFWVGIDGDGSNSVEQLGTDTDCSGGVPSYYAWYEMYPAPSVQLSKTNFPVAPGDQIEARVLVNPATHNYQLAMRDISAGTTKWTFVTNQTSTVAANASAEWVAEAPSACTIFSCHILPLTNYGTVTFNFAVAASGGAMSPISSFGNDVNAITMETQTGTIKSAPSALSSNGESFTTTWESN